MILPKDIFMTPVTNPVRRARRSHAGGFTLIEILLVLAILLMLATVAIVAVGGIREGARVDTTKVLVQEVENALDTYSMQIGHYPTEEEGGLKALIEKPNFSDEKLAEKWRGPYIKTEARDSWNNALNYQVVTGSASENGGKGYKLWSNGPDGQDGTDDDIKSWNDAQSK
jgi:general secretion pathway protein G